MMFYTMQDAALELQSVVDNGNCDTALVYERINQATRRLLNRPRKPIHVTRLIRFFTRKDIITLPGEVEKIRLYTMDGAPAPLFSSAYEFVSHGPGELGCGNWFSGANFLEDLGSHYSTFFDLPSYDPGTATSCACPTGPSDGGPSYSAFKLVAFSTEFSDVGKTLRICGTDDKAAALGVGGSGEPLAITMWDGGVEGNFTYEPDVSPTLSTSAIRDVTWVHKPATNGFVSLWTYDPATHQLYFLAKYHPHETQPRFRRYRLTAPNCSCGSSIVALCELAYVPKTLPTDILIVQNIDALKLMAMAITMENNHEFEKAKAYEADAYRLVEEQRKAERTHDYNLMQVSGCYGFGGIGVR